MHWPFKLQNSRPSNLTLYEYTHAYTHSDMHATQHCLLQSTQPYLLQAMQGYMLQATQGYLLHAIQCYLMLATQASLLQDRAAYLFQDTQGLSGRRIHYHRRIDLKTGSANLGVGYLQLACITLATMFCKPRRNADTD